jgi:hypothetical protein
MVAINASHRGDKGQTRFLICVYDDKDDVRTIFWPDG